MILYNVRVILQGADNRKDNASEWDEERSKSRDYYYYYYYGDYFE